MGQHAEGQNMMPMPNKAQPKDETELKILHKGDGQNSGKHGNDARQNWLKKKLTTSRVKVIIGLSQVRHNHVSLLNTGPTEQVIAWKVSNSTCSRILS